MGCILVLGRSSGLFVVVLLEGLGGLYGGGGLFRLGMMVSYFFIIYKCMCFIYRLCKNFC